MLIDLFLQSWTPTDPKRDRLCGNTGDLSVLASMDDFYVDRNSYECRLDFELPLRLVE